MERGPTGPGGEAPAPLRLAAALCGVGLLVHALFAPMSIAGMQIGLGIAFAGLLAAAASGWRPERTPLDLPLLALVAVCLASEIFADGGAPDWGHGTLWRSGVGFWIVWQALLVVPAPLQTGRRMLGCAAVGLLISGSVGVAQFWTGIDVVHLLHLRAVRAAVNAPGAPGHYGAMGLFISRLTFGHNALVFLSLFSGVLIAGSARGALRWLLALSTAVGLVALVMTLDRGAWLGLIAAAAALLVAVLWRAGPRKAGAALASLLPALAMLLAWGPSRERLSSALSVAANRDRVFIWSRALEIIRDHPLTGVGFGNFHNVCSRYYDRVDPAFPMRTWAHNSLLSLLAETGPLGLVCAAWLVFAIARALLSRLRAGGPYALGALAAACGLFVAGLVHDVIYDTKVMYPLWLALALALGAAGAAPSGAVPQDRANPDRCE